MYEHIDGLMRFIAASPTAFHATANLKAMLSEAGYEPLNEHESWHIERGGRYYLTRNQSSIIAFRVPKQLCDHFQIVASHSDSPSFKLKPAASLNAQGLAMLNVEKYGGMIMSTWFDRPLSVAGRLIIRHGLDFETRLVFPRQELALIPSLPIHFNRDVNNGVCLNPQVDMMPVCGVEGSDILQCIADEADIAPDSIAASDLFLVNPDTPRLWGVHREFIAAPRLDDLECAYTSAQALIEAEPAEHIDVLCVFDNEEVGSSTKQGANSTMLSSALKRIASALGESSPEIMIARSFMVSADNAHAAHPNHPEKYDRENLVHMNRGVVIKFNANQKYTSDAVSQAAFEAICSEAKVPVQHFANRSDIAGGSTLGNIANAHASMNTVDIGLAQLAMHSACETAGVTDVEHMIHALRLFHEIEINIVSDGSFHLTTHS